MNDGIRPGEWVDVEVFKTANFGAFVRLPGGERGLIHISQIADRYVKDVNEFLKVGDKVKARIINKTADGKIDLSLKNTDAAPKREFKPAGSGGYRSNSSGFEEKLKAFLKQSEKRQSDLKRNIDQKIG